MPGVADITEIPEEIARSLDTHASDVIHRRSPDGRFELELSRPGEIGMGADTWGRVRLSEDGQDITAKHFIQHFGFGLSVAGVPFYFPWDATSSKFALAGIGRGQEGRFIQRITCYNVIHQQVEFQLSDTWCSGIVWSPSADQLLLTRHDEVEIVTGGGNSQRFDYPSHAGDGVLGAWTPNGECFVVSPPVDDTRAEILQFVNATTGSLVAEEICDPLEALSFDEEAFLEFAEGRDLSYPDGHDPYVHWDLGSIESLMHHWLDAYYDVTTSALSLSTFRPTFTLATIPPLPGRGLKDAKAALDTANPFLTPGSSLFGETITCAMKKAWVRIILHD